MNNRILTMVNKKCIFTGCKKIPSFNFEGQKTALYCFGHKLENMINIVSKRCAFADCKLQPAFNFEGQKTALYCFGHKLENMINIVSKRCAFAGCKKIPAFNFEGQKTALYCSSHKLENMINIVSKRCNFADCTVRPSYGLPGHIMTRCKEHKLSGMIKNSNGKCIEQNCKDIALYSSNGGNASHCETHKQSDQINMIEKKCSSCGLPNILNKNELCIYCDPVNFKTVRLAKQNAVKNYLDQNQFKYITCDKAINYKTCKDKERPDFVFDGKNKTYILILEVDENQHKDRQELCECARMVNISQALGMPTLFIRYNPDPYKIKNIKNDPTFNLRMKQLDLVLKNALNLEVTELIGYCCAKYLYFDNFEETNVQWKTISEFIQPMQT